jgi:hypothetical protein
MRATKPRERVAGQVERGHATDHTERDHRRDDDHPLEGAELEHQHGEDAERGDQDRRAQPSEAPLSALDLARDHTTDAARELERVEACDERGRLAIGVETGPREGRHGDGALAVVVPDRRGRGLEDHARDGGQWHRAAARRGDEDLIEDLRRGPGCARDRRDAAAPEDDADVACDVSSR